MCRGALRPSSLSLPLLCNFSLMAARLPAFLRCLAGQGSSPSLNPRVGCDPSLWGKSSAGSRASASCPLSGKMHVSCFGQCKLVLLCPMVLKLQSTRSEPGPADTWAPAPKFSSSWISATRSIACHGPWCLRRSGLTSRSWLDGPPGATDSRAGCSLGPAPWSRVVEYSRETRWARCFFR